MKKQFTFTTKYGGAYTVRVDVVQYTNGQTGLRLIDVDDHSVVVTATISVPQLALDENELVIKDYSENEGVLDFLLDHNIVEMRSEYVELGHIVAPVVKLLDESEWVEIEPKNREFKINGMTVWARDYFSALDIYELAQQAEQE